MKINGTLEVNFNGAFETKLNGTCEKIDGEKGDMRYFCFLNEYDK